MYIDNQNNFMRRLIIVLMVHFAMTFILVYGSTYSNVIKHTVMVVNAAGSHNESNNTDYMDTIVKSTEEPVVETVTIPLSMTGNIIYESSLIKEDIIPVENTEVIEASVIEITSVAEEVELIEETTIEEVEKETIPEISYNFSEVPLSEEDLEAVIINCENFGIPIPIALGLIDVESEFNTTAVSSSGCYGLMQLHPKYFDTSTSTQQQIHDGLEYLSSHYKKYEDWISALNCYNAGHYTGDTKYPNKVMRDAEKWSEITGIPIE